MTNIRTSLTHPLRIAELPLLNGKIGITFCPGKKQKDSMSGCEWDRDIKEDLKAIHDWKASLVFGFPEQKEFNMLSVNNIQKEFETAKIPFIHIPFIDDTVPDLETTYMINGILPVIESLLKSGKNVLFFCKGGLGRSGLVFASVLSEFSGIAPEEAIQKLRDIRPGAICTQEQYNYVLDRKIKLS